MSERYFITGVQLGLLLRFEYIDREKLINKIIEDQCILNPTKIKKN
jgi:hypothetical protein